MMKQQHELTQLEALLLELYMPRKKIGRTTPAVDLITSRKMERQENIENYFVLLFFKILERYTPKNEYSVEKFIDRFHNIVSKNKDRVDITISEIMYFIRILGQSTLANKVAKVTGIKTRARITELKKAMDIDLLDRVKRIMRGTSRDETHSGISHPIQVSERYNAMRVKAIQNRWKMRKVQRQIAQMDAVGS